MIAPITRSLEEGSDYSPDWRSQVVAAYLKEHAAAGGTLTWEKLLGEERDVVIRQVVRYHLGSSLIPEAVRYALGCQQHNDLTGMASNIRAMAMAGFTYTQLAIELCTSRRNIFVFCRLYFDLERYINNDTWLESLLRRDFTSGDNRTRTRERRLLRIAFHEELTDLNYAISPHRLRPAQDTQVVVEQVRHAVAMRAKEYIEDLNDGGVASGPDDFNRHLMVSASLRDRQNDDTNGDRSAINAWFKEAGERGIFKDDINEIAIAMGEEDRLVISGGRRARCLALKQTSSEPVDCEVLAVSGTDDQLVVTPDSASNELQQVEIPTN